MPPNTTSSRREGGSRLSERKPDVDRKALFSASELDRLWALVADERSRQVGTAALLGCASSPGG